METSLRNAFGPFSMLCVAIYLLSASGVLAQSPALEADRPAATPGDQGGDDAAKASTGTADSGKQKVEAAPELKPLAIDTNLPDFRQLNPEHSVWTNFKDKFLVMTGEVCLRRGPLEMFACPAGTKEHESVVKVNTDAFTVHVGLLAIGAEQGHPARFHPEYAPADGTEIEVFVQWTDKEGKEHRIAAQEWVRNMKTRKSMQHPWVFAGSDFWTDEDTGKRYYQAEAGDLICVSNFPTATMDLNVKSSAANSGLLFESFEERIPPRGTELMVILKPKLEKKDDKGEKADAGNAADKTEEKPARTSSGDNDQ